MTDIRVLQGQDSGATESSLPMPRSRWKTRVLLPLMLMLVTLAVLGFAARDQIFPAREVRVLAVALKSVEGAVGSSVVQASGWVEPDPHATYVTALTPGVVRSIDVLEGDRVEEGQVVARLVREDAELDCEDAAAAVAVAEARVADRLARWEASKTIMAELVDRSETVARAEATLEAREAELDLCDADVRKAEAVLKATKLELDRKQPLRQDDVVSELELEVLASRLAAETALVDGARARLKVAQARAKESQAQVVAAKLHTELLIEEKRDVATDRAAWEQAKAELSGAQSRLAAAELRLARTDIRSPVAGIVMARLVSPGSRLLIESGTHDGHVVHIYDPNALQVRVDVPNADAALVGVGQKAEISVEVLSEHRFSGTVSRLTHLADIQKNTVEVKVSISDPVPALKPEMLARVKFLATRVERGPELRQRLLAPASALSMGGEAEGEVWIVVDRKGEFGRAEMRRVVTSSLTHEGYIEVLSGLLPGDQLIYPVPPGLEEGDRVRVLAGGV